MYITEAILIGLALAMDCFAVSITSGAIVKHIVLRPNVGHDPFVGLFQGAMVLAGWYVSTLFSRFLAPIDHWIAFGIALCRRYPDGSGRLREKKRKPSSTR